MTDAPETGTDLTALPDKKDLAVKFSEKGGIESIIAKIEEETRCIVIDATTNKGRKSAKSLAAKVSRSKTFIDDVGKGLNDERNRLNKEVNEKRNLAKDRLDALRDEIKKPIIEWEEAEVSRVRKHQVAMDVFDLDALNALSASDEIKSLISRIEATEVDASWEEFEADAKEAKASALVKFSADYDVSKDREDKEAELEKLRADAARRDEEDRKRKEDEEAKSREAERLESEARAKAQAEVRAKEKAEKYRQETEKKHAQELEEARKREEEAAQKERDRLAAEKLEEEAAQNRRKADAANRRRIRSEIVKTLSDLKPANYEEMVDAMIAGEVPYVKVQF